MPDMITDAELVADLRTIAAELHMGLDRSQDDLLGLADAVEERARQRDAAIDPVKLRMSDDDSYVLALGSLAEHRRSVAEEARRLLDDPQAAEARYRHGIGHADWEG